MSPDRMHTAMSDTGNEIAGRVTGEGPPVVLIHGVLADGNSEWEAIAPLLTEHFTCFLPSTAGRGASSPGQTHSRELNVADLSAYVDSIGEPVGLVGTSGGGMLALGVAARSESVLRLAVQEPPVLEALDEPGRVQFREMVDEVENAVNTGRPDDAAMAFLDLIGNEEEAAALSEDPGGVEELLAYISTDIAEFREFLRSDAFSPTAPEVLAGIDVPVLCLRCEGSPNEWFARGIEHLQDHIPDSRVASVPVVGHLGHLVHPELIAGQLTGFLSGIQPADSR